MGEGRGMFEGTLQSTKGLRLSFAGREARPREVKSVV